MTLPSSGSITTAQIAAEMGLSSPYTLTFPDASTRWLAGKASGGVVIPTDYYSKTWGATLSNHLRFGADASPGSTWTIPSGAPWAVGDLVIVCQYAESTDATPPAQVTPSGWTALTNSQTLTTAEGTGARMDTSYRIITSGQLGSVVTGMNGTGKNRICGVILHYNRAVSSVTVIDQGAAMSTGSPTALTMDWNSVRDASHLYVGMAHAENSISSASYVWSSGPVHLGNASVTRTYLTDFANTAPTSSITMTLPDNGGFNGHIGALLRIK